jgi:hypothetical protein
MTKRLGPLLVAIAASMVAPVALGDAIEFTYRCTTTGDGGGTQTCTAGTPLVQVQIATTTDSNILQVSARATPELLTLWPQSSSQTYDLQTLLFNFGDAFTPSLPDGSQGSNTFDTMQFFFSNGVATLPTSSDWSTNGVTIQVEDNYTTTSPWGGFDLELDLGQGNVHFAVPHNNTYDTIGFLRSGDPGFDLLPSMFNFATENTVNNHPDTVFQASGSNCDGTQQGLLSSVHFVPSDVGTNDCSGHANYGPWLGAFADPDPIVRQLVPEPASLFLVGIGLAGLGFRNRRCS